jgi:hypothetical protein
MCPYCKKEFNDKKSALRHLFDWMCAEFPSDKLDEVMEHRKLVDYNHKQ